MTGPSPAIAATQPPADETGRRILFVDHETRLSGGQRDLVDLVRALGGREDVHVALPGDGPLAEALRRHGATVHAMAMASELRTLSRWELSQRPDRALRVTGALVRAASELTELTRSLRPDVLHTNSMKAHVLGLAATRRASVPLVWHVRDVLPAGWVRHGFNGLGRLGAQQVICLSQAATEPFRRSRLSDRVVVVHNGIRPAPCTLEEIDRVRRELGAGDGELLVGIVGQIARWKGQDVFVEAAARLTERFPSARFTVVGEPLFAANEAAFAREIRARASALGLDGRMSWPGYVDPIEPVMGALDVLVHASRLPEPFGRVIVEAMAAGTPVVASRAGAGPELVAPGTGDLVDPGDPDALAASLATLLADDHARGRIGRAARDHAARFDISATAAKVRRVWDDVTVGGPAQG